MDKISAPLNMPPRYAEFAKGHVLVGFNTSNQNVDTPWLRDDRSDVAISSDYWENPTASDELGKELKDTFHEVFEPYLILCVCRPPRFLATFYFIIF